MSVYTNLSEDQFLMFCNVFGIEFKKAYPITQGIKNSNWFIQTTNDSEGEYSYVLTLFEERPPEDVQKMAIILNQLKNYLPVAPPLMKVRKSSNDTDDYLIRYEDKAITLVPCLSGSHPDTITKTMCEDMGRSLAILHKKLKLLQPESHYGVPLYPWDTVRDREIKFMPSDEAQLMQDIWSSYERLPLDDQDKLPKGLCHLDMFTDNTLWDLNDHPKLTGLLDFTEVSVENYLMDIAITINDFCTTWGDAEHGESVEFDFHKMDAFLSGYKQERLLTETEQKSLPIALSMAAVTFWLLRLNVIHYNRIGGRTGDDIMVKNPDLMKRLSALHWANVD